MLGGTEKIACGLLEGRGSVPRLTHVSYCFSQRNPRLSRASFRHLLHMGIVFSYSKHLFCILIRGVSSSNCPKFTRICPFLFTPHVCPVFSKICPDILHHIPYLCIKDIQIPGLDKSKLVHVQNIAYLFHDFFYINIQLWFYTDINIY